MKERAVLVAGGLDPTGQAGLARDVAALARERVHACPVATGLTVQTSGAFRAANPTPDDILVGQAEAALAEFDVEWLKVGALFARRQAEALAGLAATHRLRLVLDPVLVSTSGASFLDASGVRALAARLVPAAALVTPNLAEAEALAGRSGAAEAAGRLVTMGAQAVLVKRSGSAPDLLRDAEGIQELPVVPQPGHHRGTGCRLAAGIVAHLAKGVDTATAVRLAHRSLQAELALDAAEQGQDAARRAQWRELEAWLPRILAEVRHEHVPEVGMNVAYAMPGAKDPRRDVLGLAGRITIAGFDRAVAGRLAWGGPHHTGRIATVLQAHDPRVRIVMNHRYDPAYVANAARAGLVAKPFRREDEPADATGTMEWGLRMAIAANGGRVPDLVHDLGGQGKEAMIRVLALGPEDLVAKLRAMHGDAAQATAAVALSTNR